MTEVERELLLLSGKLGDPCRRPLSRAQYAAVSENQSLFDAELRGVLLAEEARLDSYLAAAAAKNCYPITQCSEGYPHILTARLGTDAPLCLWAMGDRALLGTPMVALVGSRELSVPNALFAGEVGKQAALHGFTLVSGNARGADRTAQAACLKHGGRVISIVADELAQQTPEENILYLSEDGFQERFSSHRALSRNRYIHVLGERTFVAQCGNGIGGTWDGTVKNLKSGWSQVYCFGDGSPGIRRLTALGASEVSIEMIESLF